MQLIESIYRWERLEARERLEAMTNFYFSVLSAETLRDVHRRVRSGSKVNAVLLQKFGLFFRAGAAILVDEGLSVLGALDGIVPHSPAFLGLLARDEPGVVTLHGFIDERFIGCGNVLFLQEGARFFTKVCYKRCGNDL